MRLEIPGSELIVNIGTRKQLFIDDYIVERTRWITPRLAETARWIQPPARDRSDLDGWTEGVDRIAGDVPGHLLRATSFVTRTLNQPVRFEGNPIMKRAYPWEGESAPWPTRIMYDEEEGIWKMWYNGLTTEDVPVRRWHYRCLYATSRDGITWDRSPLGLHRDEDGNDTNVFYWGKGQYILKDPEADPSRRYKMVYSTRDKEGLQHPMVQHSPDGLHWTEDPGPFSHGRGDETLGVMYDPVSRKYVGICRNIYPKPVLVHRTERSILRMQSNDLIHWSTPLPIIDRDDLDPLDVDFEGMGGIYYEGMYLGFLRVSHTASNSYDCWFAHSRDGFHWQRPRTGPFMSAGTEGSWDSKSVTISTLDRFGEEVRVYYTGWDREENTAVGMARLRLDGFVSIDASPNDRHPKDNRPTLMTKPLHSPGNRLVVNAEAPEGHIEAELLNVDGFVIDGYSREDCDPFSGDSLAHTFTWKGNGDIGGCLPARIRFYMERAKLYALQIPEG